MVDIMKIGGVTGWLSAMAQAEAAALPLSNHAFVESSAHVMAVSPTASWFEYLDIAGAVLTERLVPVGGMVTVRVSGTLEVKEIRIDPAAIDPEDPELLADMVLAAVNEALRSAQELAAQKMGGATAGLDLGALGSLGLPGF